MSKWSAWRIVCMMFVTVTGVILTVMIVQVVVVRVCVNVNQIDFLKAFKETQNGNVRVGFGYDAHLKTDVSTALFEKALSLDAHDFGTRRALGRVLLAQNKAEEAARVLQPQVSAYAWRPLFFLDVLKAYSLAGWRKEILALETSHGWQHVPESVLCRLDWGVGLSQVCSVYKKWNNTHSVSSVGKQTVKLGRAAPLAHQVACMTWMQAKGDSLGLRNSIEDLREFDLYALVLPPGSLSFSDMAVIPNLIQSGVWPLPFARRAVSWLVWRYYYVDRLEDLLTELVDDNPQSPFWPFYYGEYQHRRGNWVQADVLYRQSLDLGNDEFEILLRLGLISEALAASGNDRQDVLSQARDWYEKYLQRNDGDLLAGRLLLKVYQALGDSHYGPLENMLTSKTDLVVSVSRLLAIDPSQIRLGPNLAPRGDFNQWQYLPRWLVDKPQDWQISNMAYEGSQFNTGSFVCGPDSIYAWQDPSAHIEGIWLRQDEDMVDGRFGFWMTESRGQLLDPLSPYVISFYYRTQDHTEEPTLWLSSDTSVLLHSITGSDDYRLSATHGQWWRFVAVAWNRRPHVVRVNPLLRTFTTGEVWFDDYQISKISVEGVALSDHSVRTGIEKLEMERQ